MQRNYFKYLTIKQLEERWGIYVTATGYSRVDPHDHYPNTIHPQSHHLTWNRGRILNDYYIIFISRGKGVFASALTEPSEVAAGTCFFLYPGVLHRYRPGPEEGWEEYWVGFNGFYAEKLMSTIFSNRFSPFVDLGLNKDILILFKDLLAHVQSSLPGFQQQIGGLTIQLLGLIYSLSQHHDHADDPIGKLIAKAKFIMQDSFEETLDMERLARELPMPYSSFRKAFKRATGTSPNQYHLNLRLERAKYLLTTTALNINEIADQTGFDSVFYFSKLFKKKNGVSPKHFRGSYVTSTYLA
jgi:AraC-like DNA-binding protein